MTKKSKSTKQIRAIDRIIKFQIDDGIESLTISGKEVLADVTIDRQSNVTLFLNADPDKINEIKSLVPFVTVETLAGGTDTDKTKTVTLSQDLTQFALEIDDNANDLASVIKTQSSITLDLSGLVQKLLEIAGKLAELEQKNQEQDERLTGIEEKNESQDNRLEDIETTQEAQAGKLVELETKNQEQDQRLQEIEQVNNTQIQKIATLEKNTGANTTSNNILSHFNHLLDMGGTSGIFPQGADKLLLDFYVADEIGYESYKFITSMVVFKNDFSYQIGGIGVLTVSGSSIYFSNNSDKTVLVTGFAVKGLPITNLFN